MQAPPRPRRPLQRETLLGTRWNRGAHATQRLAAMRSPPQRPPLSFLLQRPLPPQNMMVMLRKPVRLIPQRLAQPQPRVLAPQPDRLRPLLHEDQLFLLRQRD